MAYYVVESYLIFQRELSFKEFHLDLSCDLQHFIYFFLLTHFFEVEKQVVLSFLLKNPLKLYLAFCKQFPAHKTCLQHVNELISVSIFPIRAYPDPPTSENLLDLYDGKEFLMLFSQFCHFKPKLSHVLLLRGESIYWSFLREKSRDISFFPKWLVVAKRKVRGFFLLNDHIFINGDSTCLIGQIMPGQESIFISPKRYPYYILR